MEPVVEVVPKKYNIEPIVTLLDNPKTLKRLMQQFSISELDQDPCFIWLQFHFWLKISWQYLLFFVVDADKTVSMSIDDVDRLGIFLDN